MCIHNSHSRSVFFLGVVKFLASYIGLSPLSIIAGFLALFIPRLPLVQSYSLLYKLLFASFLFHLSYTNCCTILYMCLFHSSHIIPLISAFLSFSLYSLPSDQLDLFLTLHFFIRCLLILGTCLLFPYSTVNFSSQYFFLSCIFYFLHRVLMP